jgi:hypothetical protein
VTGAALSTGALRVPTDDTASPTITRSFSPACRRWLFRGPVSLPAGPRVWRPCPAISQFEYSGFARIVVRRSFAMNGISQRSSLRLVLAAIAAACCGCGIYTFSGSTLPGHLKTVDVPLFVNESLQPDIADRITASLTTKVMGANLLRIVQGNGDATISGTIKSYENTQYFYDVKQVREASISKYIVRVRVEVEFLDNKKHEVLYKGVLNGEGPYDFATEKEADGQERAVKDVVDQIIQNSVQSW